MRLSIFNYGLDLEAEIPRYAKLEDDKLVNSAKEVVQKYDFGPGAVIVSEVFHTGLLNLNKRMYMNKGMDKSITSFHYPHPTPFLMHHEMGGGGFLSGGDPQLISVGSNLMSLYSRRKVETATGLADGYGKVATFVPSDSMVGGQKAIDALRSRRLLTISLGARVSDNDYRCSICGLSLYDDECEHSLGSVYEDKTCYAEVYNPLFREYSVVYNPSDINAMVRRMDVMEGVGAEDKHLEVDQNAGIGYLSVYEDISKVIYPSAEVNSEGGDDMGNKKDQPSLESSSAVAMSELIAGYEKKIKEQDELIAALAVALRDRLSSKDVKFLEKFFEGDNPFEEESQSEDENDQDNSAPDAGSTDTGEDADDSENSQDNSEGDNPPEDSSADGEEDEDSEDESDEEEDEGDNDAGDGADGPPDKSQASDASDSADNSAEAQGTTTVQDSADEATSSSDESDKGSENGAGSQKAKSVMELLGRRKVPVGRSSTSTSGSRGRRSIAEAIKQIQ